MTDKIKSSLTTSYMMFVFDFSDPSCIDKSSLEKEMKFPVKEVFDSQKKADHARERLGKDGFNKVLCLYFASFQNQEGFNHELLAKELNAHRKLFLRFLGKDKVNFISLLVGTMADLKEPKKGLLFGDAS